MLNSDLRIPHRFRTATASTQARLRFSSWPLAGLGLVGLASHLLVAGNYGYFRDELYYIAAGHHLALGYVDFPALIAVLAWLLDRLGGDSLIAIHIVPALANASLIVLTGLIARELGGSRYAQALAASASLVCLTFLATGSIFSMDSLDELWWTLIAYLLVRLLRRHQPRLWLLIGAVAGVGLLTKVTILFFLGALAIGLLLSPARSQFRSRWPWLAGGIAALFLLPYLVWELQHGWPTFLYWHNYLGTLLSPSPLNFAAQQAYVMNPLTLPLWLGGSYWYLRGRGGNELRGLGIAFTVLFAYFSLSPSKSYYLAPAYPMLFAAGSVFLSDLPGVGRARIMRAVYLPFLALSGMALAPIAMPILPPSAFVSTYSFLGTDAGARIAQYPGAPLPQWLADRFGWISLTSRVAAVYGRLPSRERREACVFAGNYGEAAALDLLGRSRKLPPAISGNNSYYFWGPGRCTGQVVITVGVSASQVALAFHSVVVSGHTQCTYCMPQENGQPILVARGPRRPIAHLWPTVEALN